MTNKSLIGILLASTLFLSLPSQSNAQIVIQPSQYVTGGGSVVGPLYFPDGSVTAPAISWAADTDFGWWRAGANNVTLSAGTNAVKSSLCNTYTSTTSFECFSIDWQSETNRAWIGTRTGSGGGTGRTMFVGVGADAALDYYNGGFFGVVSSTNPITFGQGSENFTVGAGNIASSTITQATFKGGIFTASSGTQVGVGITNTFNQSGTAAGTDLLINRTNTAVGSGNQYLLHLQLAGADRLTVGTDGTMIGVNTLRTTQTTVGKDMIRNDIYSGSIGDNQGSITRAVRRMTNIADNSATAVWTVTVPNTANGAAIRLRMLGCNGGTDLMESCRTAEGTVLVARVAGVDTAVSTIAISSEAIATTTAGATLTMAYGVSALTGASSATQTFTINITLDTSGSTVGYIMMHVELTNQESSGITMAYS